jgi:nitrate reductase alpha subunit
MSRLLIPLSVCIALSGCATGTNWLYKGYGAAPVGSDVVEPYGELVKVLQKGDGTTSLVESACFGLAGPDTNNKCQRQRNNAVAALMLGSENACLLHRKTMYGNDASYNIVLGSATSLFAGMASVASDVHRKSILAALALFSNSERSLINETIYKTMLVHAVDKKILELRDTQAQAMQTKLKTPIADYSVNEALSDWANFHSACSFMTGLQKALDEGIQGGNAQKILRLRNNLRSVEVDLGTRCTPSPAAPAPASAASAPVDGCTLLAQRQQKLHEELIAVESQ